MKVVLVLSLGVIACGKVLEQPVDAPLADTAPDVADGPPGAEPVEVAVSGPNAANTTCARVSDGRVFCWGANTAGQAGFAPAPLDVVPPGQVMLPAGLTPKRLLVAKSAQSSLIAFGCVQATDGTAACWGSNLSGELARGTFDAIPHPQPLPIQGAANVSLEGIDDLALGGRHACAVVGNEVRCWGTDDIGCAVTGNADAAGNCLSPDGSLFTRPVVVATVPSTVKVAAGAATSCAIVGAGGVVCWGNNKFATIGNPGVTVTSDVVPTPVSLPALIFTDVVMGNAHACANTGTTVHCWGQNNKNQIGDGGGNLAQPFELTSLSGVTALTAGGFSTCGYTPGTTTGTLRCLGDNSEGQLGNGTNDLLPHGEPTDVGDLVDIASASTGGTHACAVARRVGDPAGTPRRVFCWGRNTAGQVLSPPSARVLEPVEVPLPL